MFSLTMSTIPAAAIGADEMAGKLRAAVAARRDPDLLVIARTDAVAVTGADDAIARARAFADTRADLLFVEAPTSEDDIARVAEELAGVPRSSSTGPRGAGRLPCHWSGSPSSGSRW
jgi:2-methylisocitrate lyase-like PEP mutase family enzyme